MTKQLMTKFFQTRIEGFVNILNRQLVRSERREERRYLDELWGDTQEAREWAENHSYMYVNVFDLRRLFGLEPYVVVVEEESW
ncbi:unnamed protein product [Lasius platythorax]|uniref:Uncharacterized protein n=1 Tax=Lasius platythorax TaxID=488582 RepID=A0AAV2NW18_9HYME